jgi:hypothetical protein
MGVSGRRLTTAEQHTPPTRIDYVQEQWSQSALVTTRALPPRASHPAQRAPRIARSR